MKPPKSSKNRFYHLQDLPEIQDGAVFLADSHFFPNDQKAHRLFDQWLEHPPSQIFLMGDIFHLLIPHISSSLKEHKTLLYKINSLSQKTQLFYFEGNHDFGFSHHHLPHAFLYPRILQPASFKFQDQVFLLAHGDLFISWFYEFYIQSISSAPFLSFFRILDYLTFGKLYQKIAQKVFKKPIKPLVPSQHFISNRINQYQSHCQGIEFNQILEGHFHSDLNHFSPTIQYTAIPSFFCQKSYLQITKNGFYRLF